MWGKFRKTSAIDGVLRKKPWKEFFVSTRFYKSSSQKFQTFEKFAQINIPISQYPNIQFPTSRNYES